MRLYEINLFEQIYVPLEAVSLQRDPDGPVSPYSRVLLQ